MRPTYRKVWNHQTGESYEVPVDAPLTPRGALARGGPMVMGDLDRAYAKDGGIVSPIDGTLITSRSQLRAHEKKHGVRQMGDYKPGELIAKENRRVERGREIVAREMRRGGVDFSWVD